MCFKNSLLLCNINIILKSTNCLSSLFRFKDVTPKELQSNFRAITAILIWQNWAPFERKICRALFQNIFYCMTIIAVLTILLHYIRIYLISRNSHCICSIRPFIINYSFHQNNNYKNETRWLFDYLVNFDLLYFLFDVEFLFALFSFRCWIINFLLSIFFLSIESLIFYQWWQIIKRNVVIFLKNRNAGGWWWTND